MKDLFRRLFELRARRDHFETKDGYYYELQDIRNELSFVERAIVRMMNKEDEEKQFERMLAL